MPRIARIIVPGYPHHITQRGNNCATVFFDDDDRRFYLRILNDYTQKYEVRIWAYCLMDNHVHLLALPETEDGLARGIGLTNQVYTQYLNRKRAQSGRVWQNRFFSCVVDNDLSVWAVVRYIERNPLSAGVAEHPEGYPWSSARAHLLGTEDAILGSSTWLQPSQREAYALYTRTGQNNDDDAIRKATRTGRPLGSENFIAKLETEFNQSLRPKSVGRPRIV